MPKQIGGNKNRELRKGSREECGRETRADEGNLFELIEGTTKMDTDQYLRGTGQGHGWGNIEDRLIVCAHHPLFLRLLANRAGQRVGESSIKNSVPMG